MLIPMDSLPPNAFNLTTAEQNYVYWRALGLSPKTAAKRAGAVEPKEQRVLLENAYLEQAIEAETARRRRQTEITRDLVLDGLLEAVGVAREQSDPRNMIAGWSEIAKVAGVAAPERTEIVVNPESLSAEALAQAPTEQLLELLERRRALPLHIAEAAPEESTP